MTDIYGNSKHLPIRAALPSVLGAPLAGTVVPLSEVCDSVFAGKNLGDGVAVDPTEGRLVSPCDGIVTGVFYTGHMVSIYSDSGCKILLHIGLDAARPNSRFFRPAARPGDRVLKGELLVSFDIVSLRCAGCNLTAPMIVCNSSDYESVTPIASGIIGAGDSLLDLR